ncbi:hypothetical protein Hypma_013937 [Hypsizygus marmoreus]|uniref:Uncharacterized protein n=1 Tax=Hypsizygus marmoreus TaxID=39966 RepID=A0A369KAF7_HYPMA|nr:hypothetical protein Hypma_013937 [Hypsizygus marmoreus]
MSSSSLPRLRERYAKVADAVRARAAPKPSREADASQWDQWSRRMDGPILALNEVLPALRAADPSFVMDRDVLLAVASLERWRLERRRETPAPGDPLPASLQALARTPSPPPYTEMPAPVPSPVRAPPPRSPSPMAISPPRPATPAQEPTPQAVPAVPPPRSPSPEIQITGSTMNPSRGGDDEDLVEVVGTRAAQPVLKKEKGAASRKGKGRGGESKDEKLEYYDGSDGQERVRTVAGRELGLYTVCERCTKRKGGERCSGVFGRVCTRCSSSHVVCSNRPSRAQPTAGPSAAGPSSSRAAPRETLVARASLKRPAAEAPSETRPARRPRHAVGNPEVRAALNELQRVTSTLFVIAGRLLTMTVLGGIAEEDEDEGKGSGGEEDAA